MIGSETRPADSEQLASINGIEISYRVDGPPSGVPLVPISGLSMKLVSWDDDLVADTLARRPWGGRSAHRRDGGRVTAAAIVGAELLVIDGTGHDRPRAIWAQLLDATEALNAHGEH